MLILSRKCAEQVVFPDQNIRVEVLAVKGGQVRLGVDAPPEVRVLRNELPDRVAEWGPEPGAADARPGRLARLTTGGLAMASVGLGLARLQLQTGMTQDLEQTLEQLHEQLQWLRDQWQPDGGTRQVPAEDAPAAEAETLCEV